MGSPLMERRSAGDGLKGVSKLPTAFAKLQVCEGTGCFGLSDRVLRGFRRCSETPTTMIYGCMRLSIECTTTSAPRAEHQCRTPCSYCKTSTNFAIAEATISQLLLTHAKRSRTCKTKTKPQQNELWSHSAFILRVLCS